MCEALEPRLLLAATIDLAAASDTGVSATDNITKNTTLTIQGTAVADSTIYIWQTSPTATLLGITAANGAGNWSTALVFPGEGSYSMYAQAIIGATVETSSSLSILIDTTAPTATTNQETAANGNGWNNTNVTVSYDPTDTGGSGMDLATSDASTFLMTVEAAGQSHTFNFRDIAGNTATATISGINIDKTAPVVTAVRDTAANAQGWNNTDVESHYTFADAGGSGIDTEASDATDFTFTAEGAGQSHTFTAYDLAGNVATDTLTAVNIDKTAPVITVTRVPAGTPTYARNAVITASYTIADVTGGASGILSSNGTVADGAAIDTATVGSKGFSVTATDNAGNTTTVDRPYEVIAPTANIFLKLVKGNTYDVKVDVLDRNGTVFATGTITVVGTGKLAAQAVSLTTPGNVPLTLGNNCSVRVSTRMHDGGRKATGNASITVSAKKKPSLSVLNMNYYLEHMSELTTTQPIGSGQAIIVDTPVNEWATLGTWTGPYGQDQA